MIFMNDHIKPTVKTKPIKRISIHNTHNLGEKMSQKMDIIAHNMYKNGLYPARFTQRNINTHTQRENRVN